MLHYSSSILGVGAGSGGSLILVIVTLTFTTIPFVRSTCKVVVEQCNGEIGGLWQTITWYININHIRLAADTAHAIGCMG